MKEPEVSLDQTLMAYQEATEPAEPGKGPFDDPPAAIASQLPTVLMRRVHVVALGRNDGIDSPLNEPTTQRIAVVPSVHHQSIGITARSPRPVSSSHCDRGERRLEESDFRRGRRVQVCSQRSTRAIDQKHPLCTLAALGLADFGAPFFAGAKLPSAKHSSQRSFWRSFRSARKARHSRSNVPSSSQVRRRLQQVVGLAYLRGNSLQGAPVQRIQRMPSKHFRSSIWGRPPRSLARRAGKCSARRAHCTSVSFRHAIGVLQKTGHGAILPLWIRF